MTQFIAESIFWIAVCGFVLLMLKNLFPIGPKYRRGECVWDTVHRQQVILGDAHLLGGRWFYDVGTQTGAAVEDWLSESVLRKVKEGL